MSKYHLSEEEKLFLAQYNIERYERPSVATDMAIFSIILKQAEVPIITRR